ncbi:hypothetical protein [Telmatospirillum sp.]|uniref:hypothetical protein n=1 Tax=Telmatospirillum sp. TaxID=2079197 RepID=UPI002850EA59|nr:hypothetical protein [Telmatospirillum sp.]MDR3438722.1 hypothetical protein [Telmatospirillum sp.]
MYPKPVLPSQKVERPNEAGPQAHRFAFSHTFSPPDRSGNQLQAPRHSPRGPGGACPSGAIGRCLPGQALAQLSSNSYLLTAAGTNTPQTLAARATEDANALDSRTDNLGKMEATTTLTAAAAVASAEGVSVRASRREPTS